MAVLVPFVFELRHSIDRHIDNLYAAFRLEVRDFALDNRVANLVLDIAIDRLNTTTPSNLLNRPIISGPKKSIALLRRHSSWPCRQSRSSALPRRYGRGSTSLQCSWIPISSAFH